jgi:uncharacterized tellurite resistance protein B-like protein
MLKEIKEFFADLAGGDKTPAHFERGDYRLAAAALMVHVATLGGELSPAAHKTLHEVIAKRFELDAELTEELINAAVAADREAVDFYQFTSLLMRTLNEEGRARVIEMMWEVVFADGRVNEFEDNIMWRVADLLAVPARERVTLRQQVGTRAGADDTP